MSKKPLVPDNDKIKIGIVSTSFNIWGGGQIYIEQLCLYICRNGYACCVYTAEPTKFNCAARAIPVINTPMKRLLHVPLIAKLMRANGVSHVVLNDLSSAWLAPLYRLLGFKVISLLHIPLRLTRGTQKGHKWFAYHSIRWALRFGAHKILSVNKDNLQIAPNKAVFVGNFVPSWAFSSEDVAVKYDICFVGRISWEKNVPLLLKIIAHSRISYGRGLNLLIVGDGPDKMEIGRLVVELGIADLVTISGWRPRERLPSSFRSAKCFAVTSHHEGFATTLLESHACGRPAFTTDVGYCGTFVEHVGSKTGFVFSAEEIDAPDFYAKLFNLIDTYSDFSADCISKAELFSEDKVIGKILTQITSC